MPVFAVAGGIDVLAAGQHETGNGIENRGRRFFTREWRNG